jgi:hypothetical protein
MSLNYIRQIVDGCKKQLQTEKDPELRNKIAQIGEQFNKLLNIKVDPKKLTEMIRQAWTVTDTRFVFEMTEEGERECKKCGIIHPIQKYGIIKSKYVGKEGKKTIHIVRRRICNACTYKPKPKVKAHKNEFVIAGIQVY